MVFSPFSKHKPHASTVRATRAWGSGLGAPDRPSPSLPSGLLLSSQIGSFQALKSHRMPEGPCGHDDTLRGSRGSTPWGPRGFRLLREPAFTPRGSACPHAELSTHVLRALEPPRRGPRRHPCTLVPRLKLTTWGSGARPRPTGTDGHHKTKQTLPPSPAAACWPRGGERLPGDGVLGACPARRLCEGTLAMTQLGPELGTAPSLAQEQCPVHPVTARERKWTCGLRPRMVGGHPSGSALAWPPDGALAAQRRVASRPRDRPPAYRGSRSGDGAAAAHTWPEGRRGAGPLRPGNHVRGAGRDRGRAVVTARPLLMC